MRCPQSDQSRSRPRQPSLAHKAQAVAGLSFDQFTIAAPVAPVERPQTTITRKSSHDRYQQTTSVLQRTSASLRRHYALDDLLNVVASIVRDSRCDDDAAGQILIAAGVVANAMRDEREAISRAQKPTA